MWPIPKYAILEAPSALGHVPEHRGVERAPDVLLGAGVADGLAARRAGRVAAEGYSPVRDPRTKILNPQALAGYSSVLADALDPQRARRWGRGLNRRWRAQRGQRLRSAGATSVPNRSRDERASA